MKPSFDLERARHDTPGCSHVAHFNNAGAALMPRSVIEAVVDHVKLEGQIGGYEAAHRCRDRIEGAYDSAARLLGCGAEEVAFVENATRAWDMVFYAIPLKEGDRILTATAEYASNYIAFLQVARRTGARIEVIPNDEYGQVSVAALKEMLDDRVKLVAITHVPTSGGLVNPAVEIGRVTRQAGVLYLLDACQSVGQMPVDVREVGCDMLSTTGRKYLRGPRGTGLLYVRAERIGELEPPFLDLHAANWTGVNTFEIRTDARRFENWESYCAGRIGLGTAIDYALQWGLEQIQSRICALAEVLRAALNDIARVTVRDEGQIRCGIVTFTVDGMSSSMVTQALARQRINVSVSTMEYARLDLETRGLPPLVRASVHYYNSAREVERLCEVLAAIIRGS